MVANVFANAKVIPAAAKTTAKDSVSVVIDGLEEYGAVDSVMKMLKTVQETAAADVKGRQVDHFVQLGMKTGVRPDNFKGSEGVALASCELRVRSVTSELSEGEKTLMKQYDLPTKEVSDRPETYIINPEYYNDPEKMKIIGEAIAKIKGLPADLFQKQEARTKTVVNFDDATIFTKIFAIKDATVVKSLLNIVTIPAIKVTMSDMKVALSRVHAILFPIVEETANKKSKKATA